MENEKLVVEDTVGAVKDLHARFEKTSSRKPLGEIPQSTPRGPSSSMNLKAKLQEWESKTYTPFLTPQKQKLTQPEHVTRSEPRGRFTRGRQFDFDNHDADDQDAAAGGTSRRTSMPAAGAVKNALKQYLASAGQSEKEVKTVASPYPVDRTGKASKTRRALVPKMGSIVEDTEDNGNDENQPLSRDNAEDVASESTGSSESLAVGLKDLRGAGLKSKLAAEVKPMEEWKSPVKSITKATTPCKQKGYIFDEFAVGLKALRSPKKTEIEDQPMTVSGSIDIDEPPVATSFEVGLKALRTPKRGPPESGMDEAKPEKPVTTSSFAVGLKALKTPKKADIIDEMVKVEKQKELKSFQVGLKALKKQEVEPEKQLTPTVERSFGVNLKSVKKIEEDPLAIEIGETEETKQTFVTLKPTAARISKEDKSEVKEVTNLTNLKMKLKQVGKKREEFAVEESSDEHIDWHMAKSKLRHVGSDEKKKMAEDAGKEEKDQEVEHLDIREEKIDWTLAKTKLRRVGTSESTEINEIEKEEHEDIQQKSVGDARMSALSKSDPMDETLLVDMNDTVSDSELEGLVRCNMSKLDESSLQLGDVLAVNKNIITAQPVRGKDDALEADSKTDDKDDPQPAPENLATDEKELQETVTSEEESDDDEISFKTPTRVDPQKIKQTKMENTLGSEDESGRFKSVSSEHDNEQYKSVTSEGDSERFKSISSEISVEKSSTCDRKRVRSDDSENSSSSSGSKGSVTKEPKPNKCPVKKKPKLLDHGNSDYLTSCLSPGNLFIDPTEMSQSSKGLDTTESDMDTQSPVKSVEKPSSEIKKIPRSPTISSSTRLKRESSENMETDGDSNNEKSPGETLGVTTIEGTKVFSSTPYEESVPAKKKPKVDISTSEPSFHTPHSPSRGGGQRKLDCSVEEYSDTTNDIIKRWRERRHFLNLKGSPRTVAERMAEEEEEDNNVPEDNGRVQLPQTDDEDPSVKVRHYLSSLPGASTSRESLNDNLDLPDVKSKPRMSNASKRSSTLSHCSVRSREEMEADLDKGMKELEKRLNMFNDEDDEDDGSPICTAIRRGPPRLMATFSKTSEKLSKAGKEKTISESDEDDEEAGKGAKEEEEKKLKPSTSGSDVLDFIKEKRTRLMQIQDESIHLESDTDAEESQIEAKHAERVSRLRLRPGNRRRRSRSVGRQVMDLGVASPKNTFTEKALGRLGLCTPAGRHDIQSSSHSRSRMESFYTPYRANRFQRTHNNNGNVYIVDMNNRSGTSDASDDRYCSIYLIVYSPLLY